MHVYVDVVVDVRSVSIVLNIATFVQLGLVYFAATWLEGRPSPLGIVVPFLFLVVTGNVAYVNARIDALVRLMAEDATGQ